MMKELNLFDSLAVGKPLPAPAPVPQARQAGLREQTIGYALSRHVRAMERGFVVVTSNGPWEICGELAERMAQLVRDSLMDELAKVELPE
jgi:hypothetical protein